MIIDGKKEAAILRDEIKKEIETLKSKTKKTPGLSVILIGDFAPSQIYVKNKEKNSMEVGINSEIIMIQPFFHWFRSSCIFFN